MAMLATVGCAMSLLVLPSNHRNTAAALTGLGLSITDPFAVSPTTLDFGWRSVGSLATETVTLTNDTGRDASLEIVGTTGATVTGIASCGTFLPPPTSTVASLYLGVGEACDISVTIDTATVGPVNARLVVTDIDSSAVALAEVTAAIVPLAPPSNDDWASAHDLSSLAIPPYVGVPGPLPGTQQPRDRLSVDGSTESATYETGEYVSRPGGSVWYSYTSPPGGFAGRLGYRTTPGFIVDVTTDNTSASESRRAQGNTSVPNSFRFVRMEPGHTVWFRVFNEFVDPGQFTLELFQAPNEQDLIADASDGTGSGETALSADFNLFGDGETHHLTADLAGGAPNGWSTLRFAVPGSLSVTYRSATARTVGSSEGNEGSERSLDLRIYRSPQPTKLSDPVVLGAAIAVGAGSISNSPQAAIVGSRWETTATVAVTPGRYYWTFETDPSGPTFFVSEVRFRATTAPDTEPPTATIVTPPSGARYTAGSVPATVVFTCTDNQGATTSLVTVDGTETTTLATSVGQHTVALDCADAAGNAVAATSTYTVDAPAGPCVIVDTRSVDFGEVPVGSASSTRQVVVRSCSDAPVRLALSVSNATGAGGGALTWLASTAAVPSDNHFTWSVTPPSAPSPLPVGPTPTTVGPVLAPGASRIDDHRIILGPAGPGLGNRFTSTFVYTAIAP